MRTVLVVLVLGLGLSGCRKKTAREFYALESRATILVARDGDEGLLSDEMTGVLTALKAISPDTVEGPKAHELSSKLEADRQRVLKERADAAAALAQSAAEAKAAPTPEVARPVEPKAEVVEAPDAGPSRPWANMTVAEFQERFGVCMEAAGEKDIPGRGRMQAWEVIHTPTCILTYGITNEDTHHFFLFRNGRLAEERTEQRTITIIDAGRAPAVTQPETPRMPYVMGMPVAGAEAPDASE